MDLVTIATFNTAAAAAMAKGYLADNGVTAFVEGGAAGDMLHIPEVQLQVAEADFDRARELLLKIDAKQERHAEKAGDSE